MNPAHNEELISRLILKMTAGIGPRALKQLIEFFGCAANVLAKKDETLRQDFKIKSEIMRRR